MYAQLVETGQKKVRTPEDMTPEERAFQARVDADIKIEPTDWMPDAYRKTLDPADPAARAFGDRRHAAGRQLDRPRAHVEAQGDPDGQGAGRGRPRPLPLRRRRDARRVARPADRGSARGQGQVLVDLQLSDAHVGRHRRHRLAGRRRGDHEPDSAVPLLVRAVRAGDGAHLQGRVVPPAPGLRHHADAVPRHARAEGDGAGCARTAGGGRR